MRDPHQMIVYHVGEIVSRETIRLDQYHVVQLRVVYGDISIDVVMECGRSLCRIVLTDDKGLACCKVCLDFLFG